MPTFDSYSRAESRTYTIFDDLWAFTTASGWKLLEQQAPLGARFGASSTLYNSQFYIFGGTRAGSFVGRSENANDVWKYDLTSGAFTFVNVTGSVPMPRAHAASAKLGNNWCIVGGGDFFESIPSDVWVFSFEKVIDSQ